MSINEVMTELYKSNFVRNVIQKIGREEQQHNLQDLEQDIYVTLLESGDKIVTMYEDDTLPFFITRIILNNINSKTSQYFYTYKKFAPDTEKIINFNYENAEDKEKNTSED